MKFSFFFLTFYVFILRIFCVVNVCWGKPWIYSFRIKMKIISKWKYEYFSLFLGLKQKENKYIFTFDSKIKTPSNKRKIKQFYDFAHNHRCLFTYYLFLYFVECKPSLPPWLLLVKFLRTKRNINEKNNNNNNIGWCVISSQSQNAEGKKKKRTTILIKIIRPTKFKSSLV